MSRSSSKPETKSRLRAPWRSALGFVLCGAACTGEIPARFTSASSLPEGDRRPDGVAVDRVSEPPASRDAAPSGDSIVTLRAPLGLDVAREAVARFFAAVIDEDVATLSSLVVAGAMVQDTRASAQNRSQALVPLWRLRFSKYDYGQLGSRTVFQEGEVKSYRADQLDALPLEVQHLVRDVTVDPTVVVLRVPIATATVKNERLFGDELYFWLRRRDDRYEIYQVAEDVPY